MCAGAGMVGERWRRLEVWHLADDLAAGVYRATESFPPAERFGLVAQLRRAALSVPTNIVFPAFQPLSPPKGLNPWT